jgi:ribosomal-protein-alanine N-acetyltransferase
MRITTERLVLRGFTADDHDGVHAYASDPEVVRFMDWGPNTPEDTAAFLAYAMRSSRTRYPFAVVRRSDQALIGGAELHVVSEEHRRAELGYVLARAAWGRGYATEAARALLDFGLGSLGLHKIAATCDPENHGSAGVLRKIGMRPEGHLTDHWLIRGEWRDRLVWGRVAGADPAQR